MRVGERSDGAGFDIAFMPGGSVLRIEGWGYWDATTAARFAQDAMTACRNFNTPFRVLLDLSALKPQGVEGQNALRILLQRLRSSAMSEATVHTDSALTRMQLVRLAREQSMSERLHIAPLGETPSRLSLR